MEKVKQYTTKFSEPVQERLNEIHSLIKEIAPDAEDRISYGIIGMKLNGKYFVYFGAFKNHCSIYPFPSGVEKFKKIGKDYKTSKGTLQIPHDKPLPTELIKEMVRFRQSEIAV